MTGLVRCLAGLLLLLLLLLLFWEKETTDKAHTHTQEGKRKEGKWRGNDESSSTRSLASHPSVGNW